MATRILRMTMKICQWAARKGAEAVSFEETKAKQGQRVVHWNDHDVLRWQEPVWHCAHWCHSDSTLILMRHPTGAMAASGSTQPEASSMSTD
eukprot:1360073-Rhodomonas_salina.1